MYKTCIIGAGAAGLVAAIEASSTRGEIIVIDKNKKAGMKLYATGNGRCNLANMHMAFSCYYGNSFATDILGDDPSLFVTKYMKKLGISCYEKNGYYYPRSNQASSVVWALLDKLKERNVRLKLSTEVGEIRDDGDHYTIFDTAGNEICRTENVILATGGYSSPKLGAANERVSLHIFDHLGIAYSAVKPALCPMICSPITDKSYNINDISGVRANAEVTAKLKDGSNISEIGEVQFTDYGLSGIVIFDLSYYDDIEEIVVDTLYDIDRDSFISDFISAKKENAERTLLGFLNGYINDKLAAFILSNICKLDLKKKLCDTDISVGEAIYDQAGSFSYRFKDLYGYTHSQVTKGGILCDLIDKNTMQLKNRRGLYAIGEAVDVQGKCGGYNLMWAFRSGYLAGRSVCDD